MLKPGVFGHPVIDCDVHVSVPSTQALMPYFDAYWYDSLMARGMNRTSFAMTCDPPNAPMAARPDWRPKDKRPGADLKLLQGALETFGTTAAIATCIFGGVALQSEDTAAAMCRAVNDWLIAEWLDREPRLRASLVVPLNAPQLAVAEIERHAHDKRFVQVLMLAMGKELLGKREHWPIYEAAQRHGMPVGVHAGSLYAHPPTAGWGSFHFEDYLAQAYAFENQTLSLVSEGVFQKFPDLKFVFMESGCTWLPACLWRFDKTWRGVRPEVPWVKKPPSDIVRQHIRLTTQPFDAPDGPEEMERWIEQMGSDEMLLFSSDFPHWHYEGTDALPIEPTSPLARRILVDNALDTYPRLRESLGVAPAHSHAHA